VNWLFWKKPEQKNLKVLDVYVEEIVLNGSSPIIVFNDWQRFLSYIHTEVDIAYLYHLPNKDIYCFLNEIVLMCKNERENTIYS